MEVPNESSRSASGRSPLQFRRNPEYQISELQNPDLSILTASPAATSFLSTISNQLMCSSKFAVAMIM